MITCPNCSRKFDDAAVYPVNCRCGTRFDKTGILFQRERDTTPMPDVVERPEPSVQLGDWVERQLHRIGITPERYVEVKAAFGLPPTCGCEKRKEWLNKVSQWWQS